MQGNTLKRRAEHSPQMHYDTPRKTKVISTIKAVQNVVVPYLKSDIFRRAGRATCSVPHAEAF